MTASYQFRLRAIVLVVTALLSVLALGFRARVVRREAVIAQRIEDLGGYAFFDEEADAKPRNSVFPRLRAVAFYARSNVSDDDLSMLREIPKLKEVHLSNVSVSDRGLNLIGEIQSLAGLVLTSVPITDAGVSNLHSLHNLRWLHLEDTLVTPAGIAALRKALPNCSISYNGQRFSNASASPQSSERVDEPRMAQDVIRISILSDGELLVDGSKSSLAQLRQRLAGANPDNTVVWYYREEPDAAEPPPMSLEVLDAVMQRRIPISLSSKPDFSNVIDDKGVARPREQEKRP